MGYVQWVSLGQWLPSKEQGQAEGISLLFSGGSELEGHPGADVALSAS